MADTLKADIAKEVNITARRNDSFQLNLEVKDSNGLMDLSGAVGSYPHYQGKMTIINSSGERVLSVYSNYWKDIQPTASTDHPLDNEPSSSQEGHYSGTSSDEGIDLQAQTGAAGTKVKITVPHMYMDFQSGSYKYDLQIRKKTSGTPENEDVAEYTTWLYGSFILNADITQA